MPSLLQACDVCAHVQACGGYTWFYRFTVLQLSAQLGVQLCTVWTVPYLTWRAHIMYADDNSVDTPVLQRGHGGIERGLVTPQKTHDMTVNRFCKGVCV